MSQSAIANVSTSNRRSHAQWAVAVVVLVTVVHAIPVLLAHERRMGTMFIPNDEDLYIARTVDAFRGSSLGNPYLAEHQDAPRYMPEVGERLVAGGAHLLGISATAALEWSRIVVPVAIALCLFNLAFKIDLRPEFATLSVVLALFASKAPGWMGGTYPNFLRYERLISPGVYVLMLLLALNLIAATWKRGSPWFAVLAGVALGAVFYTQIYYWAFGVIGVAMLALAADASRRRLLVLTIFIALMIGAWPISRLITISGTPEVAQTLARARLFEAGRVPYLDVAVKACASILLLAVLWLRRETHRSAAVFVGAFLFAGILLSLQNVLTDRHIQEAHFANAMAPFWGLAAAAVLDSFRLNRSKTVAICVLITMAAGYSQTRSYLQWEKLRREQPLVFALTSEIPQTLEWLNGNTPDGSVVLAKQEIMDSLVLFTHDKVVWTRFAGQHVMPEHEVDERVRVADAGKFGNTSSTFRVDYFLGLGEECKAPSTGATLYRNEAEETCVSRLTSR